MAKYQNYLLLKEHQLALQVHHCTKPAMYIIIDITCGKFHTLFGEANVKGRPSPLEYALLAWDHILLLRIPPKSLAAILNYDHFCACAEI